GAFADRSGIATRGRASGIARHQADVVAIAAADTDELIHYALRFGLRLHETHNCRCHMAPFEVDTRRPHGGKAPNPCRKPCAERLTSGVLKHLQAPGLQNPCISNDKEPQTWSFASAPPY